MHVHKLFRKHHPFMPVSIFLESVWLRYLEPDPFPSVLLLTFRTLILMLSVSPCYNPKRKSDNSTLLLFNTHQDEMGFPHMTTEGAEA